MARTLRAAPCCMILWLFVGLSNSFCGTGGFSARTSSLPRRAEIDPVTEKFLLTSVSSVASVFFTSWVKDTQTAQTSLSDVKMEVNALMLNTSYRLATLEKEVNALVKKMDEKIAKMDEKIAKMDEKMDEKIAKMDEKISKMDEKIAKMDEKTDRNHAQLVEMIAARKRPWIR